MGEGLIEAAGDRNFMSAEARENHKNNDSFELEDTPSLASNPHLPTALHPGPHGEKPAFAGLSDLIPEGHG